MKSAAFLKIAFMILALVGVVYVMQSLRSGEAEEAMSNPESALSLLVGSDLRPLNWCPPDVNRLILFDVNGRPHKSYGANPELSRLCEIMVGGFQDTVPKRTFFKRAIASNSKGEEKVLEESNPPGVYRVQELPFSSPMLEKSLKSLLDL